MRTASLLREPLLHFLAIGAALFALQEWRGGPTSAPGAPAGAPATQVVVTREALAQVTEQFARTWQRPPTDDERRGLVEDLVRNEIYFREALAMGLDRDDEVIRRRLRMKMEFVFEDIGALAEPTDEDLRAFLVQRSATYVTEPSVSFRQVYFNPEKRGADAAADARAALDRLAGGADPATLGDATMLAAESPLTALPEIRAQFGEEFARSVGGLPAGTWSGPIRSGYGLHLVLVRERRDGRLPEPAEIRETLRRDWTAARQRELRDAAYERLRARYTVRVERPEAEAPAAGAGSGTQR